MLDCSEVSFSWFSELRDRICGVFEKLEQEYLGEGSGPVGKFEMTKWQHCESGGGQMRLMRGRVFEKVGVNVSCVQGTFSEEFRSKIPGTEKSSKFKACGISLVAHMKSPLVPSVHMNTRYIETDKSWFGGGADLNPAIENQEDTSFFHAALKRVCDKHDPAYYSNFKAQCDEYFFIKHRNEARGVGGIFYDYMYNGDFNKNFLFTKDVGLCFLQTYPEIVKKHMHESWSEDQKKQQLFKRGRYTEFNLIYDRGTKFGLHTGGNPEAILMSLPPMATWS